MSEGFVEETGSVTSLLSPYQTMWLNDQLRYSGPLQSTFAEFHLAGPLDWDIAIRALDEVWRRNEVLRSRIDSTHGDHSLILAELPFECEEVDLSRIPYLERDRAANEFSKAFARRSVDPSQKLYQVALVRIAPETHRLLVLANPIGCDAESAREIGEQFTSCYQAVIEDTFVDSENQQVAQVNSQPEDVPCQTKDERWTRECEFWSIRLDSTDRGIRDFGDSSLDEADLMNESESRYAELQFEFSAELLLQLKAMSVDHDLEIEVILVSLFQILIAKYTANSSVSVGVPFPELDENLAIGSYLNFGILNSEVSRDESVVDFLKRNSLCWKEIQNHASMPFQLVLNRCLPASADGKNPDHRDVIQGVVVVQRNTRHEKRFAKLQMTQFQSRVPIPSCDLSLNVLIDEGSASARLGYDRCRFSEEFVARFGRHYENALKSVLENPNRAISTISLLDDEEIPQITRQWNETDVSFDENVCLHELFEAQVKRTPDALALVFGNEQRTYHELDESANQLARYLQRFELSPDRSVAICLEPCIEMVVAIYAVLKAGAAYTPIAPTTPTRRLKFLLQDTRSAVLISKQRLVDESGDLPCPVVSLDVQAEDIAKQSTAATARTARPDNLAYIIYTSGSTGKPKGVMVPHRGICNTIQWRQSAIPLNTSDRVLLTLSFTFDASIWQLVHPLVAGACLVILPQDHLGDPTRMIQTIQRNHVTALGVPPPVWNLLLECRELADCKSLRVLFAGGEASSSELVQRIYDQLGLDLNNMFGPTETSLESTFAVCRPGERVNIGRPISNMRAYILDDNLQPCAIGVRGELYLAGAGVARGYLGDSALTADRFQPNPFDRDSGSRIYRTGDICRWLPDGAIDYIGRRDQQIKLHGYRIELEEIESVLSSNELVRDCVVVVREDQPGDKRIVAYFVAKDSSDDVVEELKSYLHGRLPAYMVPSALVTLASIPRNAAGKPNRQFLPPPQSLKPSPQPSSDESSSDRSQRPLEAFLAGLWEEVLVTHDFSDQDDFFELGGNSIHVAILIHKLQEALGEFVYTVALYDAPTIEKLSHYLRLNYSQAIIRLFGQGAMDSVVARSGSVITQDDVDTLRGLVRTLPPRPQATDIEQNPTAVFVLSPPRSGSTLTRIMLGGHPMLFAPPELQLLNYNTLLERKAVLSSERDSFWLEGTIRSLMEIRGCDAEEATDIMEDCEKRDLTIKEFYGLMQQWLGDVMLVEKTPTYALDVQTMRRAEEDFEDCKYIHLIRHPSPMISSFEEAKLHVFMPPFLTGPHEFTTLQLAELFWHVCHENIVEFLGEIPAERKFELRFEDLVSKPKVAMRGVADFLGIPFHADMADPYKQDRRTQMTDAIHPMARMLGDVKFHSHGKIKPDAAQRKHGRFPEDSLGEPTRKMARSFGYEIRDKQPSALVGLETQGETIPFFCVHAAGGTISSFRGLANELGSNQPFYAFRSPLLDGGSSVPKSIQEIAQAYLRELRDVQPNGPYQLGGWSFGGLVAFEMALQLHAQEQEVALLSLIDSDVPQQGIVYPRMRSRDFLREFVREQGLVIPQKELDTTPPRRLIQRVLDQAQQAGTVSPNLSVRDFRRVMVQHRRVYRANVHVGRAYEPTANVDRLILLEAEDRSLSGRGPFVKWETLASNVVRHQIPGNHYSMFRKANIQELAKHLKRYLCND